MFGYDESWVEDRVWRFASLKEISLAEYNFKDSNGDIIYIDEEAARNAREWIKTLHHSDSLGLNVSAVIPLQVANMVKEMQVNTTILKRKFTASIHENDRKYYYDDGNLKRINYPTL